MLFYDTNKRYNQFSAYLKDKFGAKVYKVTLDAGFSCPNRDGAISKGGCIFCDDSGSFSQAHSSNLSVAEQLQVGIETLKHKFKAKKFLSYLQAYSNTYKNVEELEFIYNQALAHTDVVGLSVGTRPDCVDERKLDLIAKYAEKYHVWLEYGLQSIHDKTLKLINRGHDYKCFENAYYKTKERNINVCAHVILGLPGESHEDMMATAKRLAELKVDGVKLHMLCVLKGTALEKMYKNSVQLLSEEEYVNYVCDFLEFLPPETTIHRLAGNGLSSTLIAPLWLSKKFEVLNKIDRELEKRDSYQGIHFKAACHCNDAPLLS